MVVFRCAIAVGLTALIAGCAAPPFKSQLVGTDLSNDPNGKSYNRGQLVYALPRTLVKIEAKNIQLKDKDGKNIDISRQITISVANAPDHRYMYRIMYDASASHDDLHDIKIGDSLLLNTASAQSRDRSADIIVELAKAATAIARMTPGLRADGDAPLLPEYSRVLDWDDLARYAAGRGDPLPGGGVLTVRGAAFGTAASNTVPSSADQSCSSSFCYRTLVPVVLELEGFQQSVLLADERYIWGIDTDRAALVQAKTDLTFKDGVLTGVRIDKPSTALAAASLPLTLLKAVLSVPAEILQLRVNYDSQKEAAIKQEAAVLKADDELRKLKESLAKESAADKPAPTVISPIGSGA